MLCHKIVFSPLSAVRLKPLAGPSPGCGQHLLSQLVIKPMFSLMIMRRMNIKLLQLIADFPITNSLLKRKKELVTEVTENFKELSSNLSNLLLLKPL